MRIWKISHSVSMLVQWALTRSISALYPRTAETHILFCMVDHYEPGAGDIDRDTEEARVEHLVSRFPLLADRHQDATGRPFQRTWFFPPHYHRFGTLKRLVALCKQGYGEIELHLHHGKSRPDTSSNLAACLSQCISDYRVFGIFGSRIGRPAYAFIHGDWALANSRNNVYCGVNDELEILWQTGCYADFTFPAPNEATPPFANRIYYPSGNDHKPKSYRWGRTVKAGSPSENRVMIIQGPTHPYGIGSGLLGIRIVGDAIDGNIPFSNRRVDLWVDTRVHVSGRRNWIFIKTHTHGATDASAALGDEMEAICRRLDTAYNDGTRHILHYITARELFNIVKAAEANEPGSNPTQFRDYIVSPPLYDSSPNIEQASPTLQTLLAKTYPVD